MPKVSVIVPIFNVEKYLPECLESILSRSLEDLEILCVNDGSTDSTPEILQKYSDRDRRIKVFSQSNQGAGPARNVGLREASGEFVAFIDADDFYHDDSVLERLYELAVANQVLVCGGNIKLIHHSEKDHRTETGVSSISFVTVGLIDFKDYQQSDWFTRFIYKRKLIVDNDIFFPTTRRGEDYIFCLKALLAARHFWAADFVVYVCRRNIKPAKYPYAVLLDMIEAEILSLHIASENNLDKIELFHLDRLLRHSRELAFSDSSRAESSRQHPLPVLK